MKDKKYLSFGACVMPTDLIIPPTDIAIMAEKFGLDSLFFAENSHVPIVHSKNKYHSDDIVQPFARMYDSITALSACAAVTQKLLLGTGVCLLTERDPIITAKSIASLDHLSKGRVIFGVAGGWIREAMENHGADFKKRWSIVKENALLIRSLWKEETIAFNGEFSRLKGTIQQFPKPYTRGGPPIYIGSNHKKVPSRVADYADGWMPIYDRYEGDDDPISDLKQSCKEVGRDYREMTVLLFGAPYDHGLLATLASEGYHGFIFLVPQERANNISDVFEEIASLKALVIKNSTS